MKTSYLVVGVFVLVLFLALSPGDDFPVTNLDAIGKFAEAIQKFEGWFSGSISQRNNNPGNLKPLSRSSFQGQVGLDSSGFAIFDSFSSGWQALVNQVTWAATGKSSVYSPSDSIISFFQKYAPSTDNNDPYKYANFVANYIGVSPDTTIGSLV